MIDSTVLDMTYSGWVVWASYMAIWTSVQVLFSVAKSRQ
jgi:hypothetical protein